MQKQIKINLNNFILSLMRPYRPHESFVYMRNNKKTVRET